MLSRKSTEISLFDQIYGDREEYSLEQILLGCQKISRDGLCLVVPKDLAEARDLAKAKDVKIQKITLIPQKVKFIGKKPVNLGGLGVGAPFGGLGVGAPFGGLGVGAPFGGLGVGAPLGGLGVGAPLGGLGGLGVGAPFGTPFGTPLGAPLGTPPEDQQWIYTYQTETAEYRTNFPLDKIPRPSSDRDGKVRLEDNKINLVYNGKTYQFNRPRPSCTLTAYQL